MSDWYDQDNAPNSPLEADWDDLHEDAYGRSYKKVAVKDEGDEDVVEEK